MPAADWIEDPVVKTRHELEVEAPAPTTLEVALASPISVDRITWLLLAARGIDPRKTIEDFLQELDSFVVLHRDATEFVAGTASKVWLPRGGSPKLEDPEGWSSWEEPGTVKAVGTLITEPLAEDRCLLVTETEVQPIDTTAERLFRVYWTAVAPLSGLIRRRWLDAIATRAARLKP